MATNQSIKFSVNGEAVALDLSDSATLLSILRDQLDLKGTKCGCGDGTCGTCTVIMNGKAVRSCVIKPEKLPGADIETIEALSQEGKLHPLQSAFIERQGAQCGYCTPGMIMGAKALLDKNQKPSVEQIKKAVKVNLCRCTGYTQIVESILQASGQLPSDESLGDFGIEGPEDQSIWIGRSVPRVDAKSLVTAEAKFTDDIEDPEDILFLATKRSDRAHARILSINTEKAARLPGVVRVIIAKDIPGENRYGKIIRDIPVLADEKVITYSDAVALVAAESYEIAAAACEAIEVSYEELPTLFDPKKALEEDAPRLHPKGNLLYEFDIIKGDVEAAFGDCDVTVESDFSTARVDHAQMEPEASLAFFDEDGKLSVKAPTQHVFFDRLNIVRALGLPREDVRVIQPPVGGAFGKREDVYAQIHTALAALLTRRPVRTVYSRKETFQVTQKRHPSLISVKIGATKDGRIKAFKADVLTDTGAYASWGPNILRKICVHLSGPYEIPNVRVHGKAVYTNNLFCGAMRGFGTPQAVFACESMIDILAEKLNIDKVKLREINSFRVGSKTATGQAVDKAPGRETIQLGAKKIGWELPFKQDVSDAPDLRRGRGVASLWYGIGFGAGIPDRGNAIVELTPDGKVKVFVSTVDYGQGSSTVFSQIAAETVGANMSDIEMITGDSDRTPNCGSSVATRQTYITGNAIRLACEKLAADFRLIAAKKLKCEERDVVLSDGKILSPDSPDKFISFAEMAEFFLKFGRPLRREAIFKGEKFTQKLDPVTGQGNAYHPIAYGTQFAEVTVNTVTGKVKVDRIVACHYVGKAINPESVRGQVIGGISMGYGYALSEDSRCVDGRTVADSFGSYHMMRSTDIPRCDVILLEDPEATGPFGAIGVGEPPTVATAPAIVNAINDAIGVRICSLPVTPEKILEALKRKTVMS